MKSFLALTTLVSLSRPIRGMRYPRGDVAKGVVVSSGCQWCSPGPWTTDTACNTYEYSAVASSMRNPPASIAFDASAFCSEFLRPLTTQLSIINVVGETTTSTSSAEYFTMFTSTPTQAASTTIKQSARKTASAPPHITPTAKLGVVPILEKRDFTVPDYLTAWYYYGRLDPACSCIITSASPSLLVSATETDTVYKYTVNTTITDTYTIYP